MRAFVPALSVVLLALLTGGCGGGGDSREEVIAASDRACARSFADLARIDASTVEATTRSKLAIDESLLGTLEDLDPPDERRAAFDRFVDARRALAEADRAALEAASGPPGQEALADYTQAAADAKAASHESLSAAEDYGMRQCAGLGIGGIAASDAPDPLASPDAGTSAAAGADGTSIIPGSAFVGRWRGMVRQYGPGSENASYPVSMTIARRPGPDDSSGTITYPSYPCGGVVKAFQTGAAPIGTRYVLREYIRNNRESCTSGGTITADLQGNELLWHWKRGSVNAVGVLSNSGPPRDSRTLGLDEGDLRLLRGPHSGALAEYGPGDSVRRYWLRVEFRDTGANLPPGSPDAVTLNPTGCRGELRVSEEYGRTYVFEETPLDGVEQNDCAFAQRFEIIPWGREFAVRALTLRPPTTSFGVLRPAPALPP